MCCVLCGLLLCVAVCDGRTIVSSPRWTIRTLGGPPVADVRAVAVLAPGAASAQRDVLGVLLTPLRHRARVRVTPVASAAYHAEIIPAARALVAMRTCAAGSGARTRRCPGVVVGCHRVLGSIRGAGGHAVRRTAFLNKICVNYVLCVYHVEQYLEYCFFLCFKC